VIRGAKVGGQCNIGSCAIVDGAILGDECLLGHGAFVGPGSVLGKRVFVGPAAVLCNDAWPSASKDGFDVRDLLNGAVVTVHVLDDASIGAGAILMPGVTIGQHSLVAAGAVVTRNVPAGFLLNRDGSLVPIEGIETKTRMRACCM
jgi:acetyltransferase-like isoleucine patch superfamily enzyme